MRVMLVALLLLGAPAALGGQSVALVDVTVIPMDRDTTLAHQTVVVGGERIVSVGPAGITPVPDDAVIIDGTGRFLVPGLTDAHVHLTGTVFGPGRAQFGDALLYPGPTTVGLSLTAYRGMNDAARRAGLPLVGHAPVNLSLDAMLEAGCLRMSPACRYSTGIQNSHAGSQQLCTAPG